MLTPTREIYWNIPGHLILYGLFLIVTVIFIFGVYQRWRLWRLGQPENRLGDFGRRIWRVVRDGVAQISVIRDRTPGFMHVLIYGGFVILTIGTFLVLLQADLSIQILFGQFYLWYSLILDFFGVLFILGIVFALIRRYLIRPKQLNIILDDAVILPLLLVIGITGFLIEGARIAATQPQWASWSPIGNWMARFFDAGSAPGVHNLLWWGHLLLSFAGIAYVPYSKLFHVLISPTNMYFASLKPKGELATIDIENSETFGVTDIHEFTWKQLLDLDACTHCGRCQDQCPAYHSEKPLSPKKLILDLRAYMNKRGPVILKQKKKGEEIVPDSILGEAVTPDEVWACTTCMACQEHCPVAIEHIQKIVDLRRSMVLMESKFPNELNVAYKGLETNGNPWNMGAAARGEWMEGLDIPTVMDNPDVDYLWFVGCAGSFDDSAKSTSRAMAGILKKAGVRYAVLGSDETCCGDPARRSGNEYVFQMLAEGNIEAFKSVQFKKILTSCPHCFNVIQNEYPQFGGDFEVIHHSELIADLIKTGKLNIKPNGKIASAFHDSCYLGRYHNIYQPPRDVMKSVANGQYRELTRHHDKSFCCGGGGGRFFMEENLGSRINHLRIEEVREAGVACLGVACPFCLTMLRDAAKEKEIDSIQVKDIAELVAAQLA